MKKATPTTRAEMLLARRIASAEARTTKKNKLFAALPVREQRVAIAKDVLRALGKWLIPTQGDYLVMHDYHKIVSDDYDYSLFRITGEGDVKCNACALGAIFACATKAQGDVVGSGNSNESMVRQLIPYFPEDQLRSIEAAFEGWAPGTNNYSTRETRSFNAGVRSPKERMKRIMQNIVRNDGTFVP